MSGHPSSLRARAVLSAAGLLGGASLLLFVVFLFAGPLGIVQLDLSPAGVLVWDGALSLAFFVQHSGMIRQSFRRRFERFIPEHYQLVAFAIVSGALLLAVVVLWQPSPERLVTVTGPWRWAVRVAFAIGLVILVWAARALDTFDPFGFRFVRAHLRGQTPVLLPLVVRGPYVWVRHPFYAAILILIWAHPDLTADRLLLNVIWTAWMVVGTWLEERDLVAAFGDAYRAYQREVPMLIPWRLREDSK